MNYVNNSIVSQPTKLKSYILSIYRDVLIKLPTGSKQRELVLERFDFLKNQPDYYWTQFIEI